MNIQIQEELHGITIEESKLGNETRYLMLRFQGSEVEIIMDMDELKHLKEVIDKVFEK